MSKERSRLRAQRLAAETAERAARQRRLRRRHRLRTALRRWVPRLPDRRTGRMFARRTRGQRAAIGAGVVGALVLIWGYAGTLPTKLALSLLIAAATPVVVVLALDRRI
ncbi:MAG: hypothetical protein HKP61_01845 [Dactylosporangium sp.]|nr:hypothetical protein [Dactylosporangium sp.]NNJ59706.1 hypothetical protein [Dactylosporangium sp.]